LKIIVELIFINLTFEMYQTNEITMGLQFEWEGSGGGNSIPQVPFITIAIQSRYQIMNISAN